MGFLVSPNVFAAAQDTCGHRFGKPSPFLEHTSAISSGQR
jgi:hypothetical protein